MTIIWDEVSGAEVPEPEIVVTPRMLAEGLAAFQNIWRPSLGQRIEAAFIAMRRAEMKHLITSTAIVVALAGGTAWAEDKAPPPPSITLDNCEKVTTEVIKTDHNNGTVYLQSVTCFGSSIAPKVREPSVSLGSLLCCANLPVANHH